MKKRKILISFFGAILMCFSLCCSSCSTARHENNSSVETPMAQDGKTPYIGSNGNWWIDSTDTGIKAEGEKGDKGDKGEQGIPGNNGQNGQNGLNGITPHIGSNGNWWIGNEDTGVPATGPKGDKGETGEQGLPGQDGKPGQDGNGYYPYAGFNGKKLSIIGDSITTFKDHIVPGYGTYYPNGYITDVNDTYWMKLANTLGMDVLANASWTGTCVSNIRHGFSDTNAVCASSDQRIKDLSKDGVKPDIILIYMGVNDFSSGAKIRGWDGSEATTDSMVINHASKNGGKFYFDDAYALMLTKVLKMYPEAEVYCNTLSEYSYSSGNKFVSYNNAIKYITSTLGVKLIDLHSCGITEFNKNLYLCDGIHPNLKGAEKFYRCMLNAIVNNSFYSYDEGAMHPVTEKGTVSIETPINGKVIANKLEGKVGDKITLSITPNTGYSIDSIFINSKQVSNSSNVSFNLIKGDNKVKVAFKKTENKPITGNEVDLSKIETLLCNTSDTNPLYINENNIIYDKSDKSLRTNPKYPKGDLVWGTMSYLNTPLKVGEEIEITNISLHNIRTMAVNVMNKENVTNPTYNMDTWHYWAKTNIFGFYVTNNEAMARWDVVDKTYGLKIEPQLPDDNNLHTIKLQLAKEGLNGVVIYVDGVKTTIGETTLEMGAEPLLKDTPYYIGIRASYNNSDLVGNISYMGTIRENNDNLYNHPMMYKKPESSTNVNHITGFYNNSGAWTDSDGTSTSSIGLINVTAGKTYIIDRGVHDKDYWVHFMKNGVWFKQDDSKASSPTTIVIPEGVNGIVIGGYGNIDSFKTFTIKELKA